MSEVRRISEMGKKAVLMVRDELAKEFICTTGFWSKRKQKKRKETKIAIGDVIRVNYSGEIGIVEEVHQSTNSKSTMQGSSE